MTQSPRQAGVASGQGFAREGPARRRSQAAEVGRDRQLGRGLALRLAAKLERVEAVALDQLVEEGAVHAGLARGLGDAPLRGGEDVAEEGALELARRGLLALLQLVAVLRDGARPAAARRALSSARGRAPHVVGEEVEADLARAREDRGALDEVLELADVPRKRVGRECGERRVREPEPRLPELARRLREAVREQEPHVVAARAERREVDRDHLEAVEEVLAERPLARHRREVAVRRRHDAHRDRHRARAAEPLDLARLEEAQELHLRGERQLAHLVEEQRPAVRRGRPPLARARRPRERALLVAEQLRLDERLGDRAAVHRHERPLRARAVVVDRPREPLLARPALALDEHRRLGRRDAGDRLEDADEARVLADDVVEAEVALEPRRVAPRRRPQARAQRRLLDRADHALDEPPHARLGLLGERRRKAPRVEVDRRDGLAPAPDRDDERRRDPQAPDRARLAEARLERVLEADRLARAERLGDERRRERAVGARLLLEVDLARDLDPEAALLLRVGDDEVAAVGARELEDGVEDALEDRAEPARVEHAADALDPALFVGVGIAHGGASLKAGGGPAKKPPPAGEGRWRWRGRGSGRVRSRRCVKSGASGARTGLRRA